MGKDGLGLGLVGRRAASDPYAILLVEGFAVRTSTVKNSDTPRWACDAHRAFRFPLRRPYGTVFIALMDDDSKEGIGPAARLNSRLGSPAAAGLRASRLPPPAALLALWAAPLALREIDA